MVVGATVLVDAVRDLVVGEADQVRVSLTVIGFVTGFELVVLAWSAARRGISEAVVAGVVGSYAYNATMTLGAAAVVRPHADRRRPRSACRWWMVLASRRPRACRRAARSGARTASSPRRATRVRRPRRAR
jgi:Ca2+/Na+ antiporter